MRCVGDRNYLLSFRTLRKANALFASYEEALEYLEERGLDMAHAMLLESLGRFSEAAEVHLEEGRTFDAIRLFLQDRDNEDSMHQGIQCILQCLWQRLSFAVLPPRDDPSVSLLLKFVAKADISIVSENDRKEVWCVFWVDYIHVDVACPSFQCFKPYRSEIYRSSSLSGSCSNQRTKPQLFSAWITALTVLPEFKLSRLKA